MKPIKRNYNRNLVLVTRSIETIRKNNDILYEIATTGTNTKGIEVTRESIAMLMNINSNIFDTIKNKENLPEFSIHNSLFTAFFRNKLIHSFPTKIRPHYPLPTVKETDWMEDVLKTIEGVGKIATAIGAVITVVFGIVNQINNNDK